MAGRDEVAARLEPWVRYDDGMNREQHLEQYLRLCQRLYERLEAEGSWPWLDSTDPDDLVESKSENFDI